MVSVHHRFRTIDGHAVFYREAGERTAPTIVLLHGYPTSSFMFRHLVPLLADRFHVIALDQFGYGLDIAPFMYEFAFSSYPLTVDTEALLAELGLHRFAVYVQDYGAPIGWRLALRRP